MEAGVLVRLLLLGVIPVQNRSQEGWVSSPRRAAVGLIFKV